MGFFPAWPKNANTHKIRLVIERKIWELQPNGNYSSVGVWKFGQAVDYNNSINGLSKHFNSSNLYSAAWPIEIDSIVYANGVFPQPIDGETVLETNDIGVVFGFTGGVFPNCANGCAETIEEGWCTAGFDTPKSTQQTITRGIVHMSVNSIDAENNLTFPCSCSDPKLGYIKTMLHELGHTCGFPHLKNPARMKSFGNCDPSTGYLSNDMMFAGSVPFWDASLAE